MAQCLGAQNAVLGAQQASQLLMPPNAGAFTAAIVPGAAFQQGLDADLRTDYCAICDDLSALWDGSLVCDACKRRRPKTPLWVRYLRWVMS